MCFFHVTIEFGYFSEFKNLFGLWSESLCHFHVEWFWRWISSLFPDRRIGRTVLNPVSSVTRRQQRDTPLCRKVTSRLIGINHLAARVERRCSHLKRNGIDPKRGEYRPEAGTCTDTFSSASHYLIICLLSLADAPLNYCRIFLLRVEEEQKSKIDLRDFQEKQGRGEGVKRSVLCWKQHLQKVPAP